MVSKSSAVSPSAITVIRGGLGPRVDDDIFDFVACARELTIEQLDHLRL